MQTLYRADGICDVTFDSAAQAVYVKWWKLGGHDHLRPAIEPQVAKVKAGAAKWVIVDVSEATGTPSPDDQAWFGEVVFPAYREGGIAGLVNVLPQSAITQLGARKWSKTASDAGFPTYDTGSADDAWALVRGEA